MMSWSQRLLALAVLVGLLGGLPINARAQTAARPAAGASATMLILDASNSMKGRIPGDTAPKFVLMRTALLKSLAPGRLKGQLGIVSFGSRRPADCQDVAQLLPLGPPEAERVAEALERFAPIGYSPVFPAIREAARTLGPGRPANILLVLDDLASCREDPCAAAADLKRDYPDITVNVVGLALRPDDSAKLACLTRQTGGRLFDPQDAASFATAFEQALGSGAEVPSAKPVAPPPAPVAESAVKQTPGLHLTVALDAGSGAIELPVRYEVRRADAVAGPPLIDITAPILVSDLEPGRYRVRVSAGLAQSSTDIEVAAGPATDRTIALNAGLLTVAAPHTKGGTGSASATIVIASKVQGTAAPTLLSGNVADLVVPAGSWTITAADGSARASRTIAVASGARVDAEIPLAAGRLRLDAGRTPAADILYVVTEDDPESPNGRREIVRSLAPAPEFVLPAGSYTVFARAAGGEVRETLTLRPGDDVSRTINLQTGRLALVSRLTGPAPADPDMAPSWRVVRGDDGREVARATDFAPTFELATGRYRIEGRVGGQNAIVSRDVDIKGGAEQRLQVDLPAGRIRLKPGDAGAGLVMADVYWEISDDRGRVVWRTGQAQPTLVLASGRYKVRLEMRERSSEAAFEVRAGDNRTIEVAPG